MQALTDCSTFWLNPFGVSFELMTVEDLLRIDHDGNVIEGGKPGTGQICAYILLDVPGRD